MKIGLVILLSVAALALLFATVGMVIGTFANYGSKADKISFILMYISLGLLAGCIFGVVVACIVVLVNTL